MYVYIEEKSKEEEQSNDGLNAGSVIGIVNACLVTALLVVIFAIVAVVAFCLHKKRKR